MGAVGTLATLVKSEFIWTINFFMIDCTTEQSRRAPYASAKELTEFCAYRFATMSAADSYRGPQWFMEASRSS